MVLLSEVYQNNPVKDLLFIIAIFLGPKKEKQKRKQTKANKQKP